MKQISIVLGTIMLLTATGCSGRQNDRQKPVVAMPVIEKSTPADTLLFKSTQAIGETNYLILEMNAENCRVTVADSVIPDINNKSIALCAEAAFTGEFLDEFKVSNVAGDYVIDGLARKGYKCRANSGLLCALPGETPVIVPLEQKSEWIKKAKEQGGSLFEQMLIAENGKDVYRGWPIKRGAPNIYRAACVTGDGNFAVIQSESKVTLGDFIDALLKIGVKDALYLDMGPGWNYGWYRLTTDSQPIRFFNTRTHFQTNWLVIKAKSQQEQ